MSCCACLERCSGLFLPVRVLNRSFLRIDLRQNCVCVPRCCVWIGICLHFVAFVCFVRDFGFNFGFLLFCLERVAVCMVSRGGFEAFFLWAGYSPFLNFKNFSHIVGFWLTGGVGWV